MGENEEPKHTENTARITEIDVQKEDDAPRSFRLSSSFSDGSVEEDNGGDCMDLTDEQLVEQVEYFMDHHDALNRENYVFLRFLMKFDPESENIEELLEKFEKSCERMVVERAKRFSHKPSRKRSVRWEGSESMTTSATSVLKALPAILGLDKLTNVDFNQKSELVQKELDETEAILKKFQIKYHKKKMNLAVAIEALQMEEQEIKECKQHFVTLKNSYKERSMPLTKLLRFMEDYYRTSQITCDKLRLRYSWYQVQYQKFTKIYQEKLQIGENLQEVDFEQLRIDNLQLTNQIAIKNKQMLELKKLNAKANLLVSQHQQNLQNKNLELSELTKGLHKKIDQINKLSEVCYNAHQELQVIQKDYRKIEHFAMSYVRPGDVMEYVKLKSEMHDLQRALTIWERRKYLKTVALNLSIKQLKSNQTELPAF